MRAPLRVLMLEGSERQALTLVKALQRGGFDPAWDRVDDHDSLRAALAAHQWDVVLANPALRHLPLAEAFALLGQSENPVPVIVVSGKGSKDEAVRTTELGAADFILRRDLKRLVPAIERELRESSARLGRRQAEEAMKEVEARARAIVDTAVDGIITIDERGIVETFNPAAQRIFGYPPQEVIGRNVNMLMPEPYTAQHDDYLSHYLATGERKIIGIGREVGGRRKDGSVFPMDLAVSELRLGTRRVFTGLVRDATERKQAVEAVRRERDFAERLLETAQVIVLVLDTEGRIVRFNPYMEQISGYRLDEVRGEDWFATFLPERDRDRMRGLFTHAVAGISVRGNVNPIATRDGREREIEWYSNTLTNPDGSVVGILSIGQDITERTRATRRLATQYVVTHVLATANSLAEATPQLLRAICQGAGWDLGELWRVDPESDRLHWQGLWHVPELAGKELEGGEREVTFELAARLWATGQPVHVSDVTKDRDLGHLSAARQLGLRGACAFPVESGREMVGVMAFFSRRVCETDAETVDTLAAVGQQIGNFIVRKGTEAELLEMQKAARQRDRLSDIGAITAQIVHDLGNPLAGVSMQAQLILRRALRDPTQPISSIQQSAERIVGEMHRLDSLIKEFMEFSREQRLELRPVHVPRFLSGVVQLWEPLASERGIALTLHVPDETPPVRADEEKLYRVFENLVKNAVEAIDQGPGRIRIHVTHPEPGKLRISVEDDGPGIGETVQVFRLFETTKPQGTGLGLAIVRQIVVAHGGGIQFAQVEPHGAVFHVDIPCSGPAK